MGCISNTEQINITNILYHGLKDSEEQSWSAKLTHSSKSDKRTNLWPKIYSANLVGPL